MVVVEIVGIKMVVDEVSVVPRKIVCGVLSRSEVGGRSTFSEGVRIHTPYITSRGVKRRTRRILFVGAGPRICCPYPKGCKDLDFRAVVPRRLNRDHSREKGRTSVDGRGTQESVGKKPPTSRVSPCLPRKPRGKIPVTRIVKSGGGWG